MDTPAAEHANEISPFNMHTAVLLLVAVAAIKPAAFSSPNSRANEDVLPAIDTRIVAAHEDDIVPAALPEAVPVATNIRVDVVDPDDPATAFAAPTNREEAETLPDVLLIALPVPRKITEVLLRPVAVAPAIVSCPTSSPPSPEESGMVTRDIPLNTAAAVDEPAIVPANLIDPKDRVIEQVPAEDPAHLPVALITAVELTDPAEDCTLLPVPFSAQV